MCPSLTFWVQLTILAILRFWYHLKGICLQITVLKIKWRYVLFFMFISPLWNTCLKHQNIVYVKYKGVTFLSIHMWSISSDNFAKIWYICNIFKEFWLENTLPSFCRSVKILINTLYNLMCYFDVILLSDVISSIGPKISDADTYSNDVLLCLKIVTTN